MTTISELPRSRLEQMSEAADNVLECYRILQKSNSNIVAEILRNQGEFFEWDHYPEGDIYDWESHSQYYYHAHPPENRANKWGAEHGHFHTFLRPKGMPKGTEPVPLPDYDPPEGDNDALTHFIAFSMDKTGYPIRMFTTNRWVTGEVWYSAETVSSLLEYFEIDLSFPSWPANIWLTNMVRLFRPQIEELLVERDQSVADWQAKKPAENAYEDRDLEITSIMDISVEKQIKAVRRALKKAQA